MTTRSQTESPSPARRQFLFTTVGAGLSGVVVAQLAGIAKPAQASDATEDDIRILNTALNAEREAVAAYDVGAASGLLASAPAKLAVTFRGHHAEHADLLEKTIQSLGGQAIEPPASFDFPTDQLQTGNDVLAFAAGLERGAISAYAGAIGVFANRELAVAAASILADEAMHWAVLRQALGQAPVPGAFIS